MLRSIIVLIGFLLPAVGVPEGSAAAAEGRQAPTKGYDVVLGSYVQRPIALRELVKFSTCKQPLFMQPHDAKGVAMWRVVDGPFVSLSEAEIVRGKWLECGHTDAWVSPTLARQTDD